jgi:hypothetical protein
MTETKITVTIDLEKADESITEWANEHTDTYRDGVWGVDEKGVYHMYYHTRTDIISFEKCDD